MRRNRLTRALLIAFAAFCVACDEGFDLIVDSLTVPHSVEPGASFTTQSRVCNRGDEPSGPAQLDLALKPISPPGAEVPVGGRSVPALEPGQCHTKKTELVGPASLPEGSHQLVGRLIPGGHQRSSDVFGIGHLPDLVVEQLGAPPSVAPGASFVVNGELCNRGTVWAPGVEVSLYLSSDAQLVGALDGASEHDLALGNVFVPGLPPDACAPLELMVGAAAPGDGFYLLGAIVDEIGGVSELVETNNRGLRHLIAVGWKPDLVVASLDAPNTTLGGVEFTVESVVCNQGTLPSPPSQLSLVFSEDRVIEWPPSGPPAADHPLGMLPVPSLPPGSCHTQSGPAYAFVPFDGAWTLGAIVDAPGVIEEFLEVNNTFAGPMVGVGFGPDLVVETIEAPASAGTGTPFDVDVKVCNRGTAHADPSQLRLFHSADGVLDELPLGDDPEIGMSPVGALVPGGCRETRVSAVAASSFEGPAIVIARVDPFEMVPELLESNNESVGPMMGLGWGPDLVVTAIDAPPSVHSGAPFDAAAEICNQGTLGSPAATLRFYHSVDAVVTGASSVGPPPPVDWFAGELMLAQPLPPGACASAAGTLYADPNAQGARHLGAIVDDPGWVAELIETNNVFVAPPMGVGSGPDLVVTQLAAPPTARPEGPLSLAFEICNQGTVGSPPSQVSFYDSADAVFQVAAPPLTPEADRWLGSETIPALAAGSCHAASAPAWLPPGEVGERRVGAIVDEWDGVPELVETNNVFAGPVLGVGNGPDLVVTRLDAPPSVLASGTLAVDTQVCNQGTAASAPTQLWLHLSSDAEIEGSYFMPGADPLLATAWVPSLAAGACHDEVVAGMASVPVEGAWFVTGIVDAGLYVAELVESNNTRLGDVVGVGFAADLAITTLAGPSSASAGESFFVDVEVCNQGTAWSPPSDLLLYHSADLVIDGIWDPFPVDDPLLAMVPLPGLAPGSCHLEAKSVVASMPGAGFLAATVDEQALVLEFVETNNERLGTALEVTGP